VRALAALGGSVLAAGAATGAFAATGHSAATGHTAARVVVRPGGLIRHLAGQAGLRHATSANWSGYAVHSGTYKSVAAHWTEPKGHCTSGDGHDYSSFWVGLDGYGSGTVEQTGTDTDCKGATVKHYAWFEMYPAGSVLISHPVKAGDKISASVVYKGGGKFTLSLTDHTRGWTATEHKSLSSAKRASAEVIIEAPSSLSGELPLADFGKVYFTKSKVNGTNIGSHNPTKITMVVGGRRLDKVSALSGGTNFSATWLHR
jgi:hypothetical protein